MLTTDDVSRLTDIITRRITRVDRHRCRDNISRHGGTVLVRVNNVLTTVTTSTISNSTTTTIVVNDRATAVGDDVTFDHGGRHRTSQMKVRVVARTKCSPQTVPDFFTAVGRRDRLGRATGQFLPDFMHSRPLDGRHLDRSRDHTRRCPAVSLDRRRHRRTLFSLLC